MQVAIAGSSKVELDDRDDFTYLCRICAVKTKNIIPMFGKDDDQKLVEKINKYLPIEVCNDNLLPAGVCEQCSNAVLAWHELVECCVQADLSFRNTLTVTQKQGLPQPIQSISANSQAPLDENGINIKSDASSGQCLSFELEKRDEKVFESGNKSVPGGRLRRHARLHEERAYSCDECGLGFKESGNLARHKRAIHNKLKPYACLICSKIFSRSCHLEDHLKSHSGSRNYVCDLCGKSSKSSNALRMHRRTHSAEHTIQCSFCEAKFKRKSELCAHVSVHTGEKAHVCECGKAFRLRSQLNRHAQSHGPLQTGVARFKK